VAQSLLVATPTYLAETIRDWREANKLTREKLAKHLDVCTSTIRNWEKGREPKFSYIMKMEEYRPGLIKRLKTIWRLIPDAYKAVLQPKEGARRVTANGSSSKHAHVS